MGDIHNIFDRISRRYAPRSANRSLLGEVIGVAVVCLVSVVASAASGPGSDAAEATEPPKDRPVYAATVAGKAETPVSTSPTPRAAGTPNSAPSTSEGGLAGPALTRAASRQRVEQMNPIGWLEHFGSVRIGPAE
jgi:hypothetical protein